MSPSAGCVQAEVFAWMWRGSEPKVVSWLGTCAVALRREQAAKDPDSGVEISLREIAGTPPAGPEESSRDTYSSPKARTPVPAPTFIYCSTRLHTLVQDASS